eukprot:Gb_12501 [translate_table: standard]
MGKRKRSQKKKENAKNPVAEDKKTEHKNPAPQVPLPTPSQDSLLGLPRGSLLGPPPGSALGPSPSSLLLPSQNPPMVPSQAPMQEQPFSLRVSVIEHGVTSRVPTSPRAPKEPGLAPSEYPATFSKERIASEILKKPPLMGVEAALNEMAIRVSTDFVEDVLKMSYGAGIEAMRFFRWAGWQLGKNHSRYAWNLLIDLLGKDKYFDAMWDCLKAMKAEGLLSMETFSSVFRSYVTADKVGEAMMTFEVMEQYGCKQDVVAFNSLLSALCRENQTIKAYEFFEKTKEKIKPDADTYALLLEGWEKERNLVKARHTFGEMIIRIGWNPSCTAAYNAFLNTLVNGSQVEEALKFLNVMKGRNCLPDLSFYRPALQALYAQKNTKDAYNVWEIMMQNGFIPDTPTYNAMIGIFCHADQLDSAYRLLDEMVFNGSYPDSTTYNLIFPTLIKAHKVAEASSIFREMTKNECYPTHANYLMAMKMYFEADDPEMAIMMWRHMILKGVAPNEDCASVLISGLCDIGRVSEARKYFEETITRGVKVPAATMKTLKEALIKVGRKDTYERLESKWKSL